MEQTELLDEWRELSIPRVVPDDWDVASAKAGLLEVKRARGLLEAAQSQFIRVIATETGRDTKAALARNLKMSSAEAARAATVADVVNRLPDAEQALADGRVTADQLHKLAAVRDDEAAGELLRAGAENEDTPEEFARRVHKHRIESEGDSLREQQRASRGVWFSQAENGCLGLRAVLPPVQGAQLKAALDSYVNDHYRAQHPERANVVGGHEEEPRSRRLADALHALVTQQPLQAQADSAKSAEMQGTSSSNDNSTTAPPVNQTKRVRPGAGRTAVIVTIKAETLEAEILGDGPISTADALDLLGQARVDLYAAIQNTKGQVLNFGRNRRLATPLQNLALALQSRGTCAYPGCNVSWSQCDADHKVPWSQQGPTDLDNLQHYCTNLHHPHRHETERNPQNPHVQWKQAAQPPEAA
jgi:Domain of unknown function (DUF222)